MAFYQNITYDLNSLYSANNYVPPATTNVNRDGAGVIDGQSIHLTTPQDITIDFFSGKPGQKAAPSLVAIAKAQNFKIQRDYWLGTDTADYWGPNHRLLDAAYVVVRVKIAEGETTVPDLKFITRGKTIACYNYDKSYSHYAKATGEQSTNFQLGDYVTIKNMNGSVLVNSTQIIDKWTFANADGSLNTRFRFDIDPPLIYIEGVPQITKFQMVKGSATWTMITFNYKETEGTVPTEWISQISGANSSNGSVQFSFNQAPQSVQGGVPGESSSAFSVVDANGNAVNNYFFGNAVLVGNISGSGLVTRYSWDAAGPSAQQAIGKFMVRRNVITLPASASTTDGYYNGYDVTLKRIDQFGRTVVQTKRIIDYYGSTRLATIDDMWNYGYHPKVGDSVSLTPGYADSRISINPVMQVATYITSPIFGKNLDPFRDLYLPSWLSAARKCDLQSDVTVKTVNGNTPTPGTKYRFPASGNIIWQGTVVGSDNGYIQFTNVLGKLTHKWNSWKTFRVNELVYNQNKLYIVVAEGVKATAPTHTNSSVDGLTHLSGLSIYSSDNGAAIPLAVDGNPVRAEKDGSIIPGYSLYDCDGVDYWRLLGWDEFKQRYVTQHQTNITVDTSVSMFDNVNSFLNHFGGIMRYSAGQYHMDIESPEGAISNEDDEVFNITSDHIIGKIRLSDEGIRSAFNSLTASYADPANRFESRNISFFNSEYLKADRNVPKKGSLSLPGVTNYYNTRLLADRFLNKSRFGLTASFNMAPRGLLLQAGQVIQLEYPRYDWQGKKFRIASLTHQEDATVDIVAEEYDDSFYGLSRISKQAASGLAGPGGTITTLDPPSGLTATSVDTGDETNSAVQLTWVNNPVSNSKSVSTELYSSYSSKLYVHVTSVTGNILNTTAAHELRVGELITPITGIGGLSNSRSYFIKSLPSATQIILSETKDGPVFGMSDMSGIDMVLQTANLTATISTPANSFVDVFGGIDGRVVKYYWVRHKVVQGT